MTQILVYEHPLSERIRIFLRIEHLFQQAWHRIDHCFSPLDPKECVATIVTLMQLIERTELKSELLKEFERQTNIFQRLSKTPSVPQHTLNQILSDIEKAQLALRDLNKITALTKEHTIIQSVQQRLALLGGICAFDLPAFHYWVHMPMNDLQSQLKTWLSALQPLEKALKFVLHLIRTSQDLKPEVAPDGLFQKNLDTQQSCQLIRLQLPQSLGFYPEISASKHRVNIRFVSADFEGKKSFLPQSNIGFELACCGI